MHSKSMHCTVLCGLLALVTCISGADRPGAHSCQELWFDQRVDHFSFRPWHHSVWRQRYLVNDEHWKPGGPIFFYVGNESPVDLYADNTGLMWENAEEFNALVVFAEHRYYGKSQPLGEISVLGM